MDKQDLFEFWNESFKVTRATIKRFPETSLAEVVIGGLRPPGELFAHIFAHVNGVFNACVRRELLVHELYEIPGDLDWRKTSPLVRYAERTMQGLLAHASVDRQAWKQMIKVPWGELPMESLCLEALAHEIHHRAQLFVMLRQLGLAPPALCLHERSG